MADTKTTPRPDFSDGFALDGLPDGGMVLGRVDTEDAILVRRAIDCSPSVRTAPTITVRWLTGSWSERPCDARGTTRVSACEPVRQCAHLPWTPIASWRVERSRRHGVRQEKQTTPAGGRPQLHGACLLPSSSSAGVVPAWPLQTCCADAATAAADDAQRGRRAAERSTESLEGFSRRDRAGGLDPAALAGVLCRAAHRSRAERASRINRFATEARSHRERQTYQFDALLIATGAEPVRLDIPGAERLADSLPSKLHGQPEHHRARGVGEVGRRSRLEFIGLEVAASLRTRGIAVHVVAPESQPLERVMGPEVGRVVRQLHEEHGVVFHLGQTVRRVDGREVTLSRRGRAGC